MRLLAVMALSVAFAGSAAAQAQPSVASAQAQVAPPARPLPVTAAQFDALRQVEAAGPHAGVAQVQATYADREKSLKFTTASDDFWTVVYSGGMPTWVIVALVCAAPL